MTTITLIAWTDRPHHHRVSDLSSLPVLTAQVGPTGALLLHRTAVRYDHGDAIEQIDTTRLAATLGIGHTTVIKALNRLVRFGHAWQLEPGVYELAITISSDEVTGSGWMPDTIESTTPQRITPRRITPSKQPAVRVTSTTVETVTSAT
jgi:hypothetical protein